MWVFLYVNRQKEKTKCDHCTRADCETVLLFLQMCHAHHQKSSPSSLMCPCSLGILQAQLRSVQLKESDIVLIPKLTTYTITLYLTHINESGVDLFI